MRYEVQWLKGLVWCTLYSFGGDNDRALGELKSARNARPDVTFRVYDKESNKDIET